MFLSVIGLVALRDLTNTLPPLYLPSFVHKHTHNHNHNHTPSSSDRNVPKRVEYFSGLEVTDAEGGIGHTIVLADGKVYTFGEGKDGQLGHGDHDSHFKPKRVSALKHGTALQVRLGMRGVVCCGGSILPLPRHFPFAPTVVSRETGWGVRTPCFQVSCSRGATKGCIATTSLPPPHFLFSPCLIVDRCRRRRRTRSC